MDIFIRKYNEKIVAKVANFNSDPFLIFKGEGNEEQALRSITNSIGIKITLRYPDDSQSFKSPGLRISRNADYTPTYAGNAISIYKEKGIRKVFRLSYGSTYEIHRKLETDKMYDITFIGTLRKPRFSVIRSIRKIGNNAYDFGRWRFRIPAEFMHNLLYGYGYVRVLNRSCLTSNIHQNANYGQNMRTSEACESGFPLLTDCADDIKEPFREEEAMYCTYHCSLMNRLKETFHDGEKLYQVIDKSYTRKNCDQTYSIWMKEIRFKGSRLMEKARRTRGIQCTT
ncbi:MAG: glycosyltransferase family protein [Thermoplasmataceae archaeon]